MYIKTGTLIFGPAKGGPRTSESSEFSFPKKIVSATTVLLSFKIAYSEGDHHLGHMRVQLEPVFRGTTEEGANLWSVRAYLELRDYSGEWDDRFQGSVDFILFALPESFQDAISPPIVDVTV